MIAAFALCLLSLQGDDRKPLLPILFPKPDGKNGFEFYVRASDQALQSKAVRDITGRMLTEGGAPPTSAEKQEIGRLVELLVQGSKRPVDGFALYGHLPGKANSIRDSGLRSMAFNSGMKQLVKASAFMAEDLYKTNNSRVATELLLALSSSTHHMKSGGLIVCLMGSALDSIIMAGFHRNIDRWTIADCDAILRGTKLQISPEIYIRAWQTEKKLNDIVAVATIYELDKAPRNKSESSPELDRYRKLSRTQRQALLPRFRREVVTHLDPLIASLRKPQHQWSYKEKPWPKSDPLTQMLRDLNGVEIFPSSLISVSRSLTQYRLLRLHAHIQRFRLKNSRLPATLAQTGAAKEGHDPLTNRPFTYQPTGATYRLYSHGVKETGPIEILFRR